MRTSILVLSALVLSAGVASADRGRGGGQPHSNGTRAVAQQHWNGGGNRSVVQQHWNGGNRAGGVAVSNRGRGFDGHRPVIVNGGYGYNRGYAYNGGYGYKRPYVARRPIYVQRPYVRYHYNNYYQRPSLLVENYAPMDGYLWIAGSWSWDGYQWNWIAGHYEPDPAYNEYNDGY